MWRVLSLNTNNHFLSRRKNRIQKKDIGLFLRTNSLKKGGKNRFFVTLESEFKLEHRYTSDFIGVFLWTSTFGVEVCGSSPPNSLWLPSYVVPKSGTPWGCLLLALFARFDHDLGLLP